MNVGPPPPLAQIVALMRKAHGRDLGLFDEAFLTKSLQRRLVARGLSTKLIARELDLSTKTVDAHRYQISQRLGVHDVAGMVRYAIRHGLVGSHG